MTITYRKKLFLDWSAEMRKKLRTMTILRHHGGASGMIEAVSYKGNPLTCVAFLNDTPIGWSLLSKEDDGFGKHTIMVYVKRAHRRKGIGTNLFKHLRKSGGKRVVIWDENSHYFWTKVSKKSKNLIVRHIYRWR